MRPIAVMLYSRGRCLLGPRTDTHSHILTNMHQTNAALTTAEDVYMRRTHSAQTVQSATNHACVHHRLCSSCLPPLTLHTSVTELDSTTRSAVVCHDDHDNACLLRVIMMRRDGLPLSHIHTQGSACRASLAFALPPSRLSPSPPSFWGGSHPHACSSPCRKPRPPQTIRRSSPMRCSMVGVSSVEGGLPRSGPRGGGSGRDSSGV